MDYLRLKYAAQICNGQSYKEIESDETGYPVYGSGGVFAYADRPLYKGESVLLGRKGTIDKPIYINGEFWTVDTMYYTIIRRDFVPKYVWYVCTTIPFGYYQYGSAVPSMTQTDLANTKLPFPRYEKQIAIVDYLDRRTAEIDTLLSDLQTQAEMLDTYKRELIAGAVTKGLDKSAAMKDSGVDWIGEVPVHWEITKTKWMFEIVKRLYDKEDRDVLSITQRGLKVKDIESNDGQLAESYIGYQIVNVNDFAMNSMDLLTGWVDCSPYEGVTSPDYRVFRFLPSKPQCHNYYKYLFQMCYKSRIFYRLGQGVSNFGRWRLQADQFLNMRLPQPPVREQEEIAAYLDKKTSQVNGLIADITEQIEKLKKYRQIVIHDSVTGKIRVPEVQNNGN